MDQFFSFQYVNYNSGSYNQNQPEYSDYQELEIITAPTVKSKASVYGGQNTFDVKVFVKSMNLSSNFQLYEYIIS